MLRAYHLNGSVRNETGVLHILYFSAIESLYSVGVCNFILQKTNINDESKAMLFRISGRSCGPFNLQWLALISAWIGNYIH